MNIYIIIGAAGMGKTPFVRSLIEGRRCYIFDVQNEYGMRTKYPGQKPVGLSDNKNDYRARYTGVSPENFIEDCFMKRNTLCVFEEATAFFEGRTSPAMRKLLINRYHTGNNYALIFHSINSVPPRIMEMANYVVLFRTNDEPDNVKRKYSRLFEPFTELRAGIGENVRVIKMV